MNEQEKYETIKGANVMGPTLKNVEHATSEISDYIITKFENVSTYSLEYLIDKIRDIPINNTTINPESISFQYDQDQKCLSIHYNYIGRYEHNNPILKAQSEWNNRLKLNEISHFQSETQTEDTLHLINSLFSKCNSCPKDSVPVSTLFKLLYRTKEQYLEEKQKIILKLHAKFKNKHPRLYSYLIGYPEYNSPNHLKIEIEVNEKKINFQLQNNDNNIKITNTDDNYYYTDLLQIAYKELTEIFKLFKDFEDIIFLNHNFLLRTFVNTPFQIEHFQNNIRIIIHPDFKIEIKNYDLNDINLITTQSSFIEATQGKNQFFLDKLYVRIDLCPESLKEELYQIRQDMDKKPEISLRSNLIQKISSHPFSLFRGFLEKDKKAIIEPETDEPLLPKPPKIDADIHQILADFKTQQQKIQEQNEVERTEKELLNIINYLTYQNQENKYDINDLDINNFINYSLLKIIVNLRNVTRLTIINNNDKLSLDVEYDSKNITIDNNNPLYNILLHYIYNNLELFSKNNLLIMGINLQKDHDIPFIDNRYYNNDLKTNIDKLETIRDFLFERRPFEYNPNINYQELLTTTKDK